MKRLPTKPPNESTRRSLLAMKIVIAADLQPKPQTPIQSNQPQSQPKTPAAPPAAMPAKDQWKAPNTEDWKKSSYAQSIESELGVDAGLVVPTLLPDIKYMIKKVSPGVDFDKMTLLQAEEWVNHLYANGYFGDLKADKEGADRLRKMHMNRLTEEARQKRPGSVQGSDYGLGSYGEIKGTAKVSAQDIKSTAASLVYQYRQRGWTSAEFAQVISALAAELKTLQGRERR